MTALEFHYSISQASKSLRPFALRLTKDLDDAKDLLQDTLMKAFLNRERFSEGTNLKAWLYTIMKNTFITNYQKMVKKNTVLDSTEGYYAKASGSFVNNRAMNTFASEEITRALGNLSELFRVPFMMYYNGYKYQEISDHLEIPIGTVKNRIHVARKELKVLLRGYSNLNIN